MMCEFCKNITNEVDEDLSHRHGGLALVRDKDNNHCVVQEFVDGYGEMACLVSEPIRFCPLCGRKLSKETEKTSTEELLARLKEKMTEEDYRTLQNGIKSFSDGVNALWSVLGKSIETEN